MLGKAPGFEHSSDHAITIRPADSRWQVHDGEALVADSSRAQILEEAGYPPVVYFPREDVRLDRLTPVEGTTRCPFKGEASYFAASAGDRVAWTYAETYDEVAVIAGHIAFYPDRVRISAPE